MGITGIRNTPQMLETSNDEFITISNIESGGRGGVINFPDKYCKSGQRGKTFAGDCGSDTLSCTRSRTVGVI